MILGTVNMSLENTYFEINKFPKKLVKGMRVGNYSFHDPNEDVASVMLRQSTLCNKINGVVSV